jgi:DNA-binding beta-propeller fold protein YncE
MKYAKALVALFVVAALGLAVLLTWAPLICSGKDKNNSPEKEAPRTPPLLPGFVSEGELRYEVGGTWGNTGGEWASYASPAGIAVAPDGTVYASGMRSYPVSYYSPEGKLLGGWSHNPTGAFGRPVDVAVGPAGNVYVADGYGGRVQIFSAAGKYLGDCDRTTGMLRWPSAVAVAPDGRVYVADYLHEGRYDLSCFDARGVFLRDWMTDEGGPMDRTCGAAVGADGTVYLAKYNPPRVERLSPKAEELGEVLLPRPGRRRDGPLVNRVAVDAGGRVYALGGWFDDAKKAWRYKVWCFGPDGALAREWDPAARTGAAFASATDIKVGPDGNLWVAAWGSDNVHVFTPEGEFVRAWEVGGSGPGPEGRYGDGYALAFAADGTAFVADAPARRIRCFGPDGDFLGAWGADGVFWAPGRLDIGPDGHVYLVDEFASVLEFTPAGGCVRVMPEPYAEDIGAPSDVAASANGDVFVTYGDVYRYPADGSTGELFAPGTSCLAVDGKGTVYMPDAKTLCIRRYSPEGELLGKWGGLGSGPSRFTGVWDVAVGPEGRIYVADSDKFRVQVFTPEGKLAAYFSWRTEVVHSTYVTLAVAPNGDVYVGDGGYNRIIYFKRVGAK